MNENDPQDPKGERTLAPVNPPVLGGEARERPQPANWKLAFDILAACTCTGFVSSEDVSRWVEHLRQAGEEEAAQRVGAIFNRCRTPFMQNFMG